MVLDMMLPSAPLGLWRQSYYRQLTDRKEGYSEMAKLKEVVDGLLPDADERRRIRLAASKTQEEMAVLCGVTLRTIERWESGATPSSDKAMRYAQILKAMQ